MKITNKRDESVSKANTCKHAKNRPIRLKNNKVAAHFGDHNYKELEKRKQAAFRKYIRDNKLNDSTNGLELRRGEDERKLPVVIISSSLMMDKNLGNKITKICPSDKGLNLDNRCGKGIGLHPEESFEVRWDDGTLIAVMLRNVFSKEDAKTSLLFEEEHRTHSKGWNRGCEADLVPRVNKIMYQLNNERPMKSTGINPIATILSVKPGGKGNTTCTRAFYQHLDGNKTSVPFSSFIDRMKWVPSGEKKDSRCRCYDEFLERVEGGRDYFSKMKTTYLELCTYFMGGDVINEISDDIVKTIRLNTNIIDDKESTMGIHHDIPTPTPAMATGSTNYRFEDGEWTLKQNGGRLFIAEGLFWLDYRPTDCVAFDGNIPHGVSRLRPIHPNNLQPEYRRFSIIMFSVYKRTAMRSHGYNRK